MRRLPFTKTKRGTLQARSASPVLEMFGSEHDAVTATDSDELCSHVLHPRLAERSCFITLERPEGHRLSPFCLQGSESEPFLGDRARDLPGMAQPWQLRILFEIDAK